MKLYSIASFVVGVVLTAGVIGGGAAFAKGGTLQQATKKVSVKFELVRTDSAGKKRSASYTLIADSYATAEGKETMIIDNGPIYQECSAYAYPQGEKIMLKLHYVSDSQPISTESTSVDTTVSVKSGETTVVKGADGKTDKANAESLLFVTATIMQ